MFAEADLLKLCDMGIATERRYDEETETTFTRTSIGTLLYMSPEQVRFQLLRLVLRIVVDILATAVPIQLEIGCFHTWTDFSGTLCGYDCREEG